MLSIRLKTLATALNLLIPKGKWRPLEIFTLAPIQEEHAVKSGSGRSLRVRLWRPRGSKGESRALLVYAPSIEGRGGDPRMANLAATFARAGFAVAAPWRDEDPFIVNSDDIEDVIATVLFLRDQVRTEAAFCGLFGISAYSGAVIAAAANRRIKDQVRFVVSFAGYYDLENVFRFVQTGQYWYKDIRGRIEPDVFTRKILAEQVDHHGITVESLLAGSEFEKLRRDLSPSSFVDQVDAEFFIIHSTDDAMIPHTESMRLADALKPRVPVHLTLTAFFDHGSYKKLNIENLRLYYLPGIRGLYGLLYALLSRHS